MMKKSSKKDNSNIEVLEKNETTVEENKTDNLQFNNDETENVEVQEIENNVDENLEKTDNETTEDKSIEEIKLEATEVANIQSDNTNIENYNVGGSDNIDIKKENNISKQDNTSINKISNNKEDSNKYETISSISPKKSKLKKFLLITLILLIIFFIITTLSTIFAIVNLNNKNIITGISIGNEDISNLSIEEANSKVSSIVDNKLSQELVLYYGNYELKVMPSQFEVSFDIEGSVSKAYSIGRSGNLIKDNFDILNLLIKKCTITPAFKYNEDSMNKLFSELQANIPDHLVEPAYYIEDNKLIITNGEDGIVVQKDLLKQSIINFINDFSFSNTRIEIPIQDRKASSINIDKIYSEVHKEAKDAYFTKDPYAIYPHVNGVDFAISIEEAKKIVETKNNNYTIPLKVLTPQVTTNDLGTEAFPNLLSTFSTTYSTSNVNRSTNIYIAAKKINGIVIMPGETFSYNQTVGKRTAAAGFKEAAVYAGGKVTTDIGGGICQVSSTLYNAVLLANLEIVERENHAFNPGYVKAGTDATVSWGYIDFRFKNTRNYPIKVVCSATNGTVLFNLYGLKEQNEYDVVVEATITSYIPYSTVTENDPTLEVGQTKVLESGSSGCRSVTYRVLKQNGKEVSRTLLSQDTYLPHNRVIAVGTKAPAKKQEQPAEKQTKEEPKQEVNTTVQSESEAQN